MSFENLTLAHFLPSRGSGTAGRHFSSLFTLSHLYICRESSTNQPFYAKQTQFLKKSNDVIFFYTMDYENKSNWTLGKSKPNSNPIKPNLKRAKMNANVFIIKNYKKKMILQSE